MDIDMDIEISKSDVRACKHACVVRSEYFLRTMPAGSIPGSFRADMLTLTKLIAKLEAIAR